MHPAPSVILFTVLSGFGLGLLIWLGLGYPGVTGWKTFIFYVLAYGLTLGGLLASSFHLGNRKNALKAFSQWRSSWLSREAWLVLLTLLVMGGHGFGVVFLASHIPPLGWLGAALALATVFATSMIYAQLKTVPRWNHWTTPALFVSLALTGGALLAGQAGAATVLLTLGSALQLLAWGLGDRRFALRGHTAETATGLGQIGQVRQLEPPHSSPNYLMKEMVFSVARKHSLKLRAIALLLMFVIPLLLLVLLPGGFWICGFAAVSFFVGTLVSRWLFFAEARHVVSLYYGDATPRQPGTGQTEPSP